MPPSKNTGAFNVAGESPDASQDPSMALSPDTSNGASVEGRISMLRLSLGEYASRDASVTSLSLPSANVRPYSTPDTGTAGSASTFIRDMVIATCSSSPLNIAGLVAISSMW